MLKRKYENSFANTFEAMQCLAWTVLYDEMGFEKDTLIKFQKGLTDKDKIIDDGEKFREVKEWLLDDYQFNCRELANKFPFRAKMNMAGYDLKKPKGIKVALIGIDSAIEILLVILLYELLDTWWMSREDAEFCIKKMAEISELYNRGMRNKFIQKYFKDEIDLDIKL